MTMKCIIRNEKVHETGRSTKDGFRFFIQRPAVSHKSTHTHIYIDVPLLAFLIDSVLFFFYSPLYVYVYKYISKFLLYTSAHTGWLFGSFPLGYCAARLFMNRWLIIYDSPVDSSTGVVCAPVFSVKRIPLLHHWLSLVYYNAIPILLVRQPWIETVKGRARPGFGSAANRRHTGRFSYQSFSAHLLILHMYSQ